ncbi:ComF family protein [Arenimonas aestuarii]
MRRALAELFAGLGPALLPWRCLVCTDPGAGGVDLCLACRHDLPWNRSACARCGLPLPRPAARCGRCLGSPPIQASTRAVFRYSPPLDRLLLRLKFHGDLAAGRLLAALLAEDLAGAPRPAALVPIPLHRRRLRQRGYDQALELARPLAGVLALPLLADGLQRARATAPQSELDARARRRNVRGAFQVSPGITLPAHVALFDDVMTTGATLAEAARQLRRAGVARVDLWVAARA